MISSSVANLFDQYSLPVQNIRSCDAELLGWVERKGRSPTKCLMGKAKASR